MSLLLAKTLYIDDTAFKTVIGYGASAVQACQGWEYRNRGPWATSTTPPNSQQRLGQILVPRGYSALGWVCANSANSVLIGRSPKLGHNRGTRSLGCSDSSRREPLSRNALDGGEHGKGGKSICGTRITRGSLGLLPYIVTEWLDLILTRQT